MSEDESIVSTVILGSLNRSDASDAFLAQMVDASMISLETAVEIRAGIDKRTCGQFGRCVERFGITE